MARNLTRVLVQGDGIAALCCAHLLGAAGLRVAIDRVARPSVPSIMLSHHALALLRDVFARPDLLGGVPPIDRRVVRWGTDVPNALAHAAVVVPEEMLIEQLAEGLDLRPPGADAEFTVRTATSPSPAQTMRFGSRHGTAVAVRLRDAADHAACWIEAVDEGWLFLVPNALGTTWLLGVGAPVEALIAASRLIAPRIELLDGRSRAFDTCPRLAAAVCGAEWLLSGTAAIAFDPICGDGAANAVREAILASAVIVAIAEGGDAPSLLAHYEAMLIATMRRHLALCTGFYESGGQSPWWLRELEALRSGHDWCTAKLTAAPEPRYQLEGFRLVPRGRTR